MSQKGNLTTPIQYLKGIGPRRAEALSELGITTVRDLLYYFPYGYVDLSSVQTIAGLRASANSGSWLTVIGTVRAFDLLGRPPKQRFVVLLGDATGTIQLVFFRQVSYFKKAFQIGETLAVSGKVTLFGRQMQIVHPSIDRLSGDADEEGDQEGFLHTRGLVPKYGSTGELKEVHLHVKGLRKVMKTAVEEFVDLVEEPLPPDLLARHALAPLREALRGIHFPDSVETLERARHRLKFDELFFMQLMLATRRQSVKSDLPGVAFNVESGLARSLKERLPFTLTKAQVSVLKEITDDMKSPKPMSRLLQGDVGSGKTVVALFAMLIAVDNGYQAAFMAPTEILAEQHAKTLSAFLKDQPVSVRLLVGSQRSKLREDILEDVRRGSAQIVVGTHALIQESVQFARLGLIVIDEQHRFGVAQRLALKEKAAVEGTQVPFPDLLVMTATPIPRTLSLTLYGDLDVSLLNELPAHRQSIRTALRPESKRAGVYEFVREQVKEGRQAYIVYPLIEESEKLDLKAATESYELLRTGEFKDLRLALLHGKMPSEEKEEVMGRLKSGKIDVLVATTVIEVGIDVPNASVMVIEHAERFGLSQLHQLRGRVGRGSAQSYCILVAPDWLTKIGRRAPTLPGIDGERDDTQKAARRLHTMVDTTDGFKIAEIDLEIRGPGEFFGTRQSGLPQLQLANLMTDGALLIDARAEAYRIVDEDPHLRRAEHGSLRKYFAERLADAMTMVQGG
jgi:ATP-dependent DNA helicase RecG